MNGEFYNHKKVAEIVEQYCYEHRMSESDFADLLGVHSAHLPRIKGGKMCSYEILCKIAALGKIEISELLRAVPDSLKREMIQIGSQKNIPVFVK